MITEPAIAYAGLVNQISARPFVGSTACQIRSVMGRVDCICGNVQETIRAPQEEPLTRR